MKKAIKRGLLIGGLTLATLLGCGDNKAMNSPNSGNDIYENPKVTNVKEHRENLIQATGDIHEIGLEDKVNEVIDGFYDKLDPNANVYSVVYEDNVVVGDLTNGELDEINSEDLKEVTLVYDFTGKEEIRAKSVQEGSKKVSLYLEYDEANADFDGNHKVDFEDFFYFGDHFHTTPESPNWDPKYDLIPDGRVTFSDFFVFGDNFATTVNVAPSVDLELDKDEINVGDELRVSAFADDKENDPLNFKWYVNDKELSETRKDLVNRFDVAGEFDIKVKAVDSYGSESQVASKRVVVNENEKLSLNLPDKITIEQYVDGEEDGHVETVNLDEFVEDSKFSDSDLEWEVEFDGENKFERYELKGDSFFGFEKDIWYESKKIKINKDGSSVELNPGRDYNNSDYEEEFGKNFVNFKVKTPDGREVSKKVEIIVDEHKEFNSVYNRSATERGYHDPNIQLEKAYIWMGNTWNYGDSRDPRTWTGRPINDAELEDFEWLINEEVPRSSPLVPELDYLYQEDWEKIYDVEENRVIAPERSVLLNINKSTQIASAASFPQNGESYQYSLILYNPDQNSFSPQDGKGIPREALIHEWGHVLGFAHPNNPSENDKGYVFSMWFAQNGKEYAPPLSEAIQRIRYEKSE